MVVPCGPLATRVAASFFIALAFKNIILPTAFPPSTEKQNKSMKYDHSINSDNPWKVKRLEQL